MDLFHGMKAFVCVLASMGLSLLLLGCDIGEGEVASRGRSPSQQDGSTNKAREANGIFSREFSSFETQVSQLNSGLDGNYYIIVPPSEEGGSSILMKSADGEVWQALSLPARTDFGQARSLAVDSKGHIYVIGSEAAGVYLSTDGGDRFAAIDFGTTEAPQFDKLITTENDSIVAANLSEFFVISNLGQKFTRGRWPAGLPNDTLMVFAGHNQIFTRVLNSSNQGIAASKNNGQTFTLREAAIAPHFMAMDNVGVMYAIDSKGILLKSADKGMKFSSVGLVATDAKILDFAIDANNWIYALTPKVLYYSSDAGKSFKTIPANLGLNLGDENSPEMSFKKMMILKNRRVLVSTGSKVFISQ